MHVVLMDHPITALTWRGRAASRAALLLGLLLISVGVALNWRLSQARGEDFSHLYIMGVALVRGFDLYTVPDLAAVYKASGAAEAYTPWGVFYTPSSGVAVLPLLALPLAAAKLTWFAASTAVLLLGFDRLLGLVAPRLPTGYRVLALGALLCSSAARWPFLYLQAAPLVFGLLCLELVALHRRRTVVALLIAALAVCLKFTLGLPFLGLALVQRRYALAVGVVAIWLLANGLGFARLGGLEAVAGYQQNMALFERADQLNYPDFRLGTSMQRLDWPYLLNAISPDLPRSDALGDVFSLAAAAWLAWQWHRTRAFARELATSLAFFGPLVCLSLLSIYHHHYDAIALFGPAAVYVAQYLRQPGQVSGRLVALFVVPVVLFAGVYEVGEVQNMVEHLFGEGPAAMVKLLGVVSVVVAFAASLLLLRDFVRGRETARIARAQPAQAARRAPAAAVR